MKDLYNLFGMANCQSHPTGDHRKEKAKARISAKMGETHMRSALQQI